MTTSAPSAAESLAPRGSDYARLSREVRQAGLMDRQIGRYAWRITITVVLLAAGWAAFVLVGNSWWQIAVAVFLAIMFTQVGFLGHDAGHRQISGSRRASYILGILLGNLGIGLSFGWWVSKHNRHHANPNTEGADPDIMMSVLAFTPAQAGASRGLYRLLFRLQAYLFFPLLLGEALSLHVASVSALAGRGGRHRRAEAALLALHLAGYLTVVFLVLSPVKAIVFIVVQQGLFGLYLGASFAPNHKGMPILQADDNHDFLRRQVLTSRNVRGNWLTDLALGGLNYQIEHHLFPSMPRYSLRRSQPLIRDFCLREGLPYSQASLVGSYLQALGYLRVVGRQSYHLTARPAVVPLGLAAQDVRPCCGGGPATRITINGMARAKEGGIPMINPEALIGSPSKRTNLRAWEWVKASKVMAVAWLAMRVWLGIMWIQAGWAKLFGAENAAFLHHNGAGVAGFAAHGTPAYTWWGSFLHSFVVPNAGWIGILIAVAEFTIGVALVAGLFTRIAALGSLALLFTYVMSGTASVCAWYALFAIVILVMWRTSSWIGIDGLISRYRQHHHSEHHLRLPVRRHEPSARTPVKTAA